MEQCTAGGLSCEWNASAGMCVIKNCTLYANSQSQCLSNDCSYNAQYNCAGENYDCAAMVTAYPEEQRQQVCEGLASMYGLPCTFQP